MTIIDLMHNALFGVVKVFWLSTLFHSNALRERMRGEASRELDYFNLWIEYVRTSVFLFILYLDVICSSKCHLGWAGGSLTADEYKALILAFLPIAVCHTCWFFIYL